MQRYFSNNKIKKAIHIVDQDAFQIRKVLRMKANDKIEVVCDNKLYLVKIIKLSNEKIETEIINEILENPEPRQNIHLYMSLLKKDKFEWVVQKATELGVKMITPVITERTIIKLNEKNIVKKLQRWQTIMKEAAEQSKRIYIPKINSPIKLDKIPKVNNFGIAAYEEEKGNQLYLKDILDKNDSTINLFIGPEGGVNTKEIEKLKEKNFKLVSLGKRILRSETAAVMLLSLVTYEKELKGEKND